MENEDEKTQSAMAFRKVISRNIKVLMALNDVKQKDLGKALGITQATVSQKLSGQRSWTVDDIALAADYFNVSPSELVNEDSFVISHDYGSVAPAGARYFVRPEDGGGRNPGRNGRARAFVMPGAMGWGSVPRVGLEPTLRRF